MNSIFKAVCVFSIGLIGLGVFYDQSPRTFDDLSRSSVQVEGYCSGTVIPDPITSDGIQTTVLTAAHCVYDLPLGSEVAVPVDIYKDNVLVETKKFTFKVKDFSKQYDLAILQMEPSEEFDSLTDPAKIGNNPEFGEDLWAVTYPKDIGQLVSYGIAGHIEELLGVNWMTQPILNQATLPILPGSSGGSVYKYSFGNGYTLAGVVTGQYGMSDFVLVIPVERVWEYLGGLDAKSS